MRLADSLTLQQFLSIEPDENTPDQSRSLVPDD
jgi:hypothetical protein